MRKIVKITLAAVVYYSGLLRLATAVRRAVSGRPDLLILMYHRVIDGSDPLSAYAQSGLTVSPEVFDRQMAFLKCEYHPTALSHVVERLRSEEPLPPKAVVVTFDDGWRDNYLHAYPILKKHSIPATIFLSTDFIESGKIPWFLKVGIILSADAFSFERISDVFEKVKAEHPDSRSAQLLDREVAYAMGGSTDRLMELLKSLEPEMTDRLINEMASACGVSLDQWSERKWMIDWNEAALMNQDIIDFGSHGCSHRILTQLTSSEAAHELSESARLIRERLGTPLNLLAYPNGDYNDEIRRLAVEAGYRAAVATRSSSGESGLDLFGLGRVGVHESMSVGLSGRFSKALFAFGIHR
jgi:peptidoglycan/xylan/chitin deacetylase (PgdA/CDA1 family)